MRSHSNAATLQQWLHALRQRWQQPRSGAGSQDPASTLEGEASHSTLFMHSEWSREPEKEGFKIRIARRPSVLEDALGLLNRRYRQRGYGSQTLTMSPERMTVVAYEGKQVIGTLTIQLDTSKGLLSDECFPEPLNGLRARGASLCEFTKLATAPHAPMPSTLASMFHVAFIFAHQIHRATHAVVEVNPRHVAFYTRVLGFTAHGAPTSNPRVKAPGVLLVADFKHIGQQLMASNAGEVDSKSADSGKGAPPPFFSHSFSSAAERGIRHRIMAALKRQEDAA